MHHLSTELLLSLTGTRMTHVPYKATPPAVTDLIAGHIQVLFGNSTTTVPLIQQGQLRAAGSHDNKRRSAALPDVPTAGRGRRSRLRGRVVADACCARRLRPKSIALLNNEVRTIFSDPTVQKELSGRGIDPQVTGTPEQLNAFVRAEIERWRPIVHRAGVALASDAPRPH